MIEKLLNTRHYKAGYEIRTEEVRMFEEDRPIIMKSAYTSGGKYIGNSKDAYRLCVKMGIAPALRTPDSRVCSIGFCNRDQKFYGWSHRAIHGFGIGDTTKKGDCGYIPSDVNEIADAYKEWNDLVEIIDDATIEVFTKMCDVVGENPDGSLILEDSDKMESYEVETGRGEWTAKTLEDARQMACDFAAGVS